MKIYTVTKAQIIDAVKNEPLLSSGFFFATHGPVSESDLQSCKVCAVGSVLRRTIGLSELHDQVNDWDGITNLGAAVTANRYASHDDLTQAVDSKNWMGALSIKFEQLCEENYDHVESEDNMHLVREELSNYVDTTFPNEVTFKL